jgi:nucleotide-binding universal stress UspA family protein
MKLENDTKRSVILVAVDRTPASDPALETAATLANANTGAELHLLHVVPPMPETAVPAIPATALIDDGRKFVDGVARTIAERYPGRLIAHLAVGEPGREILQLAGDLEADVIIVGTHAKNAVERILVGSVAQAVVRKAHCAVVVAREKEYPHEAVPEIEPPCPKCVETQRSSKGRELWCDVHSGRHAHAHLHYETPKSFALGSMLIRP